MTNSVVSQIGRRKLERECPPAATYSQSMHDVRAKAKFRIRSMGRIYRCLRQQRTRSDPVRTHSRPTRFNRACYLPLANICTYEYAGRVRCIHARAWFCDKSSLLRTRDVVIELAKRDASQINKSIYRGHKINHTHLPTNG